MAGDDKKKILIIENQWREFESLYSALREKYEILAIIQDKKEEQFIKLATSIRIWVDRGYNDNYREKAFEAILCYAKQADLIIMDHILGGSYFDKTGIDLATKLKDKLKEEDLNMPPVLFLSKTEVNEQNRLEEYDKYKRTVGIAHTYWKHKGYLNAMILDENYIEKHVVTRIENLLNTTRNETKTNRETDKSHQAPKW